MEKKDESIGSSSSIPFPWSKVWSANCIPRCKDLAWRACHEILPVLTTLQKKKIVFDQIYPMCGEAAETTEHALIYCSQVAPIWFASQLGIEINGAHNLGVQNWLQRFLNLNDKDAAGLGVVFRNHQGQVMAYASLSLPNIKDPMMAEAMGIQ
ncbi:Reverse transcriptase zinc-binding domain [Sesbania bispinosa]|nr:Reverse transcriptase zinc-binding domain [Sesbania bispinosa]